MSVACTLTELCDLGRLGGDHGGLVRRCLDVLFLRGRSSRGLHGLDGGRLSHHRGRSLLRGRRLLDWLEVLRTYKNNAVSETDTHNRLQSDSMYAQGALLTSSLSSS